MTNPMAEVKQDWADEAFNEIAKVIRSGWDMDTEIKKILCKAKTDGMAEGLKMAIAHINSPDFTLKIATEIVDKLAAANKLNHTETEQG